MRKNWPSGRPRGWAAGTIPAEFLARQDYVETAIRECRLSPPLGSSERGALIYAEQGIKGSGTTFRVTNPQEPFNPDLIRSTLLLFDRLDYPANNAMQIGPESPPGLDAFNVFSRSKVLLSGSVTSEAPKLAFNAAYLAHEQRQPGLWSVVTTPDNNPLEKDTTTPEAAFRFKLIDALPIPDRSVPYEDVLAFKQRRLPELMALRHHIEELSMHVAQSGTGGLAETVAFERFEAALANHVAASREANFLKRLTSLEVGFQWDKLVDPVVLAKLAAAGAWMATMPSLPAAWAALGMAAAPIFRAETTLRTKNKDHCGPFEYLFRAGREL